MLVNSEGRRLRRIVTLASTAALILLAISPLAHAQRAPVRDPDHVIRKRVCSYQELQRRNIVMQQRDFSCGAAALATLVRYYWGDDVTEETFLRAVDEVLTDPAERADRIENGLTLTDLKNAAEEVGYVGVMTDRSLQQLREAKAPVIVGIVVGGYDHFAVYRGMDDYYVYLADPARGNLRVPLWEFRCQWQKNAILIVIKKGVDPPTVSPLSVRSDEIYRGATTRQNVRRELTKQHTPTPLPIR